MINSLRDPISYVFEKNSIFDVASESVSVKVSLLYPSNLRNVGGAKLVDEVVDWYPQIFIRATPGPAILPPVWGFVPPSGNENAITLHACSDPELNVCVWLLGVALSQTDVGLNEYDAYFVRSDFALPNQTWYCENVQSLRASHISHWLIFVQYGNVKNIFVSSVFWVLPHATAFPKPSELTLLLDNRACTSESVGGLGVVAPVKLVDVTVVERPPEWNGETSSCVPPYVGVTGV